MFKKIFNCLNKNSDILIMIVVFFISVGILLTDISTGRISSYNEGYKQGQLDFQRGVIQWKNEDGQIWHLESSLK